MRPTTAGYYWYRYEGEWMVVEVWADDKGGQLLAYWFRESVPTLIPETRDANWGPKIEPPAIPPGELKRLIYQPVDTERKCPYCGEVFKFTLYRDQQISVFYCQRCNEYYSKLDA